MEGSSSSSSPSPSSCFHNVERPVEETRGGEEAGGHDHQSIIRRRNVNVAYGTFEENLQLIRVSCAVVIPSFWLFVSGAMIFGTYGPSKFLLGPDSWILIRPNSLFVQYVKVEDLEEGSNQPMLYGFYRTPPLDVVTTFSDTHKTVLPARSHEEWVYFLNQGSQMNISYTVNSRGSSPVIFVISQGNEGLYEWLEDPSSPNFTLSWNTIHGSGMIQQDIYMSSRYYVAVANLNDEAVEIRLNVKIRASLYNTSGAYYACSLSRGECHLDLSMNGGNVVLLTSPRPSAGRGEDQWNVKLLYGPRWMSYITGTAIMITIILLLFRLLNILERGHERTAESSPLLLANKEDSSWGSSDECLSQDDEALEDGEYNNNTRRRLCAICFDAPRDCFFLPCGHCVACFACGTRIAEAAGTCPICRRPMKKVRKIFTV